MSTIGSPIETSILQAAQAQQTASKARDKEQARTETGRRFKDQVELRVAELETADAVRRLPSNDSQQAHDETHAHDRQAGKRGGHQPDESTIDIKA